MPKAAHINPEHILALFTYHRASGRLIPNPNLAHTIRRTDAHQWEIGRHRYSVHRLVWAWHHPDNPNPKYITFADGDRTNTRIENLRATNQHPRWAGHTKQRKAEIDHMGNIVFDSQFDYQ